jgi:hypothetical protein
MYRKPPEHQADMTKIELPHNKYRDQRKNIEGCKREKNK